MNNYVKLAISLAGFAVIIGTQYLYEESWYEWSFEAIPKAQEGISDWAWAAWNVYTKIGGAMFQIAFVFIWTIFS